MIATSSAISALAMMTPIQSGVDEGNTWAQNTLIVLYINKSLMIIYRFSIDMGTSLF
jgi:hypothetical protein